MITRNLFHLQFWKLESPRSSGKDILTVSYHDRMQLGSKSQGEGGGRKSKGTKSAYS